MNKATRIIAATIKGANIDNAARMAIGEAFFANLSTENSKLKRVEFLGACGVTKTVRNLMSGTEITIAIDTPPSCDPSRETYWSM